MNESKFLFLVSELIPHYYVVVDTENLVTLRVTVNEWKLNADINFDKRFAETLMEPNNLCTTLTQSQFIETIAHNFSPKQKTIIDGLIKQLGS